MNIFFPWISRKSWRRRRSEVHLCFILCEKTHPPSPPHRICIKTKNIAKWEIFESIRYSTVTLIQINISQFILARHRHFYIDFYDFKDKTRLFRATIYFWNGSQESTKLWNNQDKPFERIILQEAVLLDWFYFLHQLWWCFTKTFTERMF